MRQPEEQPAGRRRLRAQISTTARFASVVARAGRPEIYLPLIDPKQDRHFMRAVREDRVLSLRQEPASKRKDFGVVGFDEGKHTTYLIFPKPLTAFLDSRIIGINYDLLREASTAAHRERPAKTKTRVKKVSKRGAPARGKSHRVPPPTEPKHFRVLMRITLENEVSVHALNKTEAKREALDAIGPHGQVKVLRVEEV